MGRCSAAESDSRSRRFRHGCRSPFASRELAAYRLSDADFLPASIHAMRVMSDPRRFDAAAARRKRFDPNPAVRIRSGNGPEKNAAAFDVIVRSGCALDASNVSQAAAANPKTLSASSSWPTSWIIDTADASDEIPKRIGSSETLFDHTGIVVAPISTPV